MPPMKSEYVPVFLHIAVSRKQMLRLIEHLVLSSYYYHLYYILLNIFTGRDLGQNDLYFSGFTLMIHLMLQAVCCFNFNIVL